MTAQHDPERHLTQVELDAIRGPFISRPANPEPRQWLRWAREVIDAAPLAQQILNAQAEKAASPRPGKKPAR
jgi:hypothetical protein